jgi:cytochrome c oxidase cbb3-type subunit III
MDNKWIYGSAPEQIFASIVQGRPNGMPTWSRRIPEYQVWQLVAYVRCVGGLAKQSAAPGREDHMTGKKPENSMDQQEPRNVSTPQPVGMPR